MAFIIRLILRVRRFSHERAGEPDQTAHEKEQKTYIYDEGGNEIEMKKPLWGFCDGENIFVYHKSMYRQIITLGRFCVFNIENYKRNRDRYKSKDYFFDIKDGEVFELNPNNLRDRVLCHEPVLLEKFENESMKKSMCHWYINEVNSKYK